MIEDIEQGKIDICDHLVNVRGNPQRVHELVELLESKIDLSCEFPHRIISANYKTDMKKYFAFCEAYIIYLFNNFIVDDEDTEIMLVAFNYLPAYAHEKRAVQRRALYAREVYEPRHPEKNWGKSDEAKSRGLYIEESRIMKGLSEVLARRAVEQDGTLKLIEDVLAEQKPAEVEETIVATPNDVEPTEPSKTGISSQLMQFVPVEQVKGHRRNYDSDTGEQSLVPDVYVNNRADATNVTNVQVVVVMPENTATDKHTRPSMRSRIKALAPQLKSPMVPTLKLPKPALPSCRNLRKSHWLIILVSIIAIGIFLIGVAYFQTSGHKDPDNTSITSPNTTIVTVDPGDNDEPGNNLQPNKDSNNLQPDKGNNNLQPEDSISESTGE